MIPAPLEVMPATRSVESHAPEPVLCGARLKVMGRGRCDFHGYRRPGRGHGDSLEHAPRNPLSAFAVEVGKGLQFHQLWCPNGTIRTPSKNAPVTRSLRSRPPRSGAVFVHFRRPTAFGRSVARIRLRRCRRPRLGQPASTPAPCLHPRPASLNLAGSTTPLKPSITGPLGSGNSILAARLPLSSSFRNTRRFFVTDSGGDIVTGEGFGGLMEWFAEWVGLVGEGALQPASPDLSPAWIRGDAALARGPPLGGQSAMSTTAVRRARG